MDVIALSDLHGSLIEIEDEFDLMLIAGDICPVTNHNIEFQYMWLNKVFVDWINKLNFKDDQSRVVMIGGNHDIYLDGSPRKEIDEWVDKCNGRLVYLDNEEYVFNHGGNEYRIFGTPYCKIFGNWAFMRENLDKYYEAIPEGLDFLISHDAADTSGFGMIREGWHMGTNAGNRVLCKYLLEKKPKFYFCGHIHSGNHILTDIGNGTMGANVSIMNESYADVYKPLKLRL